MDAPKDHILTYPDPRLRKTSAPVEEITPELIERVKAMFPLMYEAKGIGLAAPQIGWHVRLFVMNVRGIYIRFLRRLMRWSRFLEPWALRLPRVQTLRMIGTILRP